MLLWYILRPIGYAAEHAVAVIEYMAHGNSTNVVCPVQAYAALNHSLFGPVQV